VTAGNRASEGTAGHGCRRPQLVWPDVVLLLAIIATAGCGGDTPERGESTEARRVSASSLPAAGNLTTDEQIHAVREGRSRRIEADEPLSSEQWQAIAGLTQLEELVLQAGRAEDAEAEWLASLPALTKLVLRDSPLSDAGFASLARCACLRDLNVPQAACTPEGLVTLKALPQLRSLRVGGPNLAGAAVCEAVVALPKLRFVHLVDVEIGDAGLAVLERRPDLWSLYLDGAGVSDAAWGRYFQVCPDVHVHVDQLHHDRDPEADHDGHPPDRNAP
jgi:hypothetical protein